MAVLGKMPELAIIKGFKGKLDFYERQGQACVRKWPYTPRSHLTEGTKAQWPDFAHVRQSYKLIDSATRAALVEMSTGSQQTTIDVFHALAYGNNVRLVFP